VSEQYSLREAERYCRKIATSHYENFLVASILLPRRLHQHFYNIYAYCRIADDLADETGSPERAMQLLDWWEDQLVACYHGDATHPVFVALRRTNDAFCIPMEPYQDLLRAFRRDQVQRRYATYDELLGYCRYSANPVGRLVLHLFGFSDEHRRCLSDATCTALQLTNFWQDVVRDYENGRIYLPECDMRQFGVTEETIRTRTFTPQFGALLRFECQRTEELFAYGAALTSVVPRRLAVDVEMFTRGGREVLRRIAAQGYDVLSRRPTVPRRRQLSLLLGAAARVLLRAG